MEKPQNGDRKGDYIYNAATNRWLKYGSISFKKWVQRGQFDQVLSNKELMKYDRKKSPRKIWKVKPKRIDIPPEVRSNILGFTNPKTLRKSLATGKFMPKDVLMNYPIDLSKNKICSTFKPSDMQYLLKNVNINKLDLYRCALLENNQQIIKILSKYHTIVQIIQSRFENNTLEPSDLKLLVRYKDQIPKKLILKIIHTYNQTAIWTNGLILVTVLTNDRDMLDALIEDNAYIKDIIGANYFVAVFIHYMMKHKKYELLWQLVNTISRLGWDERVEWYDEFDWEEMTRIYYEELYPEEIPEGGLLSRDLEFTDVGLLYTTILHLREFFEKTNTTGYEVIIKPK